MKESAVVTLLFTDLESSTELLDQLGEDAAESLRRTHFGLLRDAVAAHGGREVKSLGDGLMTVFSSTVDAAGCAVAIQQAVHDFNQRGGNPLRVRIGVHVGEPIRDEDDYFGMPVVVARRLCDRAEGGQILTSEVVRLLVSPREQFKFKELGPLPLKGILDPVPACQLVWEPRLAQALPLPPRLEAAGVTPFVGREVELGQLETLWRHARQGQRRLVALAGEPGIGKTRLATQLAHAVHDDGATVLFGACDEDPLSPYQPVVEALRFYVANCEEEALRAGLGAYPPELARLLPELAQREGQVGVELPADPDTDRFRLFDAMTLILVEACRRSPLLLILDDLHWADRSTSLLLRHLVRSTEQAALLIVGTYRDTDLHRSHPFAETLADLRRAGASVRLNLRGLSQDEVLSLVVMATGHQAGRQETALAERLWAETEGNALFIRETLRHLAETGGIDHGDDQWSIERLGIPEGVKEVIERRLVRLSDDVNLCLSVASVIGREFDFDVLKQVTELSEDALLNALDEGTAAGLISEAAMARYGFSHAMVRETLYEGLGTIRRLRLHSRVVKALEELHDGDLDPYLSELASHSLQAAPVGDAETAIGYAVKAADRANAQLAFEEAVDHYERALAVLAQSTPADQRRQCELLLALAQARARAGDVGGARQTWEQAADTARESDAGEMLVRAAQGRAAGGLTPGIVDHVAVGLLKEALVHLDNGDSPARAEVLAFLAVHHLYSGGEEPRASLMHEAVATARRFGDDAVLAAVLNRQLQQWGPEDLAGKLATAREVVVLADRAGEKHVLLRGHYSLLLTLLQAGDVAAADREIEAYTALAEELRHPYRGHLVPSLHAMRALMDGRIGEADHMLAQSQAGVSPLLRNDPGVIQRIGSQLVALRREQGRLGEVEGRVRSFADRYPAVPGWRCVLAMAYSEIGRQVDARGEFEVLARDDFAGIPGDINWLTALTMLAETCCFLADAGRARILYELMLPYRDRCVINAAGSHVCLGVVDRYLGMLASTMGRWSEAEGHFEAAMELAHETGARAWKAHTEYDWAVMLMSRAADGDQPRASALLDRTLATAGEGGMSRLAERAAELKTSLL